MSPSTPCFSAERRNWWRSSRKIADRYVRDARALIATQTPSDVVSALSLLDAALSASPRHEPALELRARSLLFLRRFSDVADMLQDYIPSYRPPQEGGSSSGSMFTETAVTSSSSQQLARERVKLLRSASDLTGTAGGERSFRCLSVSDLKKKVFAGLTRRCEEEGRWRYIVLGQACYHLGMMEDAMVLLQTGRRHAAAAFRRESLDLRDDGFSSTASLDAPPPSSSVTTTSGSLPSPSPSPSHVVASAPPAPPPTELESAANLLNHVKLLLRRRAAAAAAHDAGLHNEAVRHYSKILDSRRGTPHAFVAACLVGRAAAYRSAGRVAEAIADLNRSLALEPASIPALRARAEILESVKAVAECLRDLEHLKIIHDAILRDRKLPGPPWRPPPEGVRYRDIPDRVRVLTSKIQDMKRRLGKGGEACVVDYYTLMGIRRGCSRSELDRAHLLLTLRHRPEKSAAFVDRVEFGVGARDVDTVRDEARLSALILYRMLQKGYHIILTGIMEVEAVEKHRVKEAAAAAAARANAAAAADKTDLGMLGRGSSASATPFPAGFCRDLAVVGTMLSQAGAFGGCGLPVTCETLSC